jgi:hypothetical protein
VRGIWRKVGDTAVPLSPRARSFLEKIKENGVFSDEKNPRQLGLFWVLCQIVADNLGDTKEGIKNRVLVAAKYIDATWLNKEEIMCVTVKSIAKMKRKEFDQFFKDAVPIMAGWLGTAPEELQAEAMERFNDAVDGGLSERIETYRRG